MVVVVVTAAVDVIAKEIEVVVVLATVAEMVVEVVAVVSDQVVVAYSRRRYPCPMECSILESKECD